MRFRPLTSGVLATALAATAAVGLPALASAAPTATAADIVLNEVESNGDAVGDWVELANTNATLGLDISGWTIVDDDPKHTPLAIPAGTVIESGGYFSVYTDVPGGFGLGGADSVTVRDTTGKIVDSTSWTAHAKQTWGRLPDKTGAFADTAAPTRNARNAGGEPDTPPVTTAAFPGDPLTVAPVTGLGPAFAGEDMSGVDFDSTGNLYVVNNGTGTVYVLAYDAATTTYSVAKTFVLTYPDGTGLPDAEGVTVGPDGVLYVATERDNADKNVSRPSLLRVELPATGTSGTLPAKAEYDLRSVTGTVGPNAGLEAAQYIPGAWGGVVAVGGEGTGKVHFVQPQAEGTVTVKQTFQSPFPGVMALDYDATTKKPRVLCDEACEGRSIEMTFDGTTFVTDGTVYARPAGTPNLANEGFASHRDTVACTEDGAKGTTTRVRYLWADDGASDGVALRGALGAPGPCTVADSAPGVGSLPGGFGSLGAVLPALGSLSGAGVTPAS